jgi:prophage regulatory protein
MNASPPSRLIRLPEVLHRTSLSEATLRRMMKDGSFPQALKLGANSVAWLESEIDDWIDGRPRA